MLWALMPCGLLYSALLVAALTGSALQGGLAMALFALGSGLSLWLAPWLLLRLHAQANRWRRDWGTRLAGLLLAGAAGWALWMDVASRLGVVCT
jgi:sulfite exporter TauE/SafE